MNKGVFTSKCATISLMVLLVLGGCTPVNAQEKGRAGVTMGYPASVGFVFHVTDGVALRPELSFDKSSYDHSSSLLGTSFSSSSDHTVVGVGLSALFYVGRWDNLRTYVSPRITYTRATSTVDTPITFAPITLFPISTPATEKITNSYYSGAGSFGAQYSLSPKFGVFGEVGLDYRRSTTPGSSTFSETETKATNWGTRSGVGVVFYF